MILFPIAKSLLIIKMSYLLDKKSKRKKVLNIAILIFSIAILFYFRVSIFKGLSFAGHSIFRPVFILQNKFSNVFSNLNAAFSFKNSLLKQNENLQLKLLENNALLLGYQSILDENIKIKEILGRKNEKIDLLLSAILAKPNQSPYDTLIIDVGAKHGVQNRNLIFALGNIPIGRIVDVYPSSSKVVLFSNSGEKTEVSVTGQNVFMQITGRGGGNFEMVLPRDFVLEKGSTVVLPGSSYVVAVVKTIISDPRDSFIKALLVSPANVQELKFVEVKL